MDTHPLKPVIIGAGIAGLTAALALAPTPVIVLSPCALGDGCSSAWAQGGIAAAMGDDDDAALHAQDTVAAGNELNDDAIVRLVTQDGRAVIERLIGHGVAFDRDDQGRLRLGLEAAHSKRRIVHAKDATGLAVTQALIAAARAAVSIEIIEHVTVRSLLVDDNGVSGIVLCRNNILSVLPTRHCVLASGGAAGLWHHTTNPHQNWGGGLALAARAGARLGDLEFVQFHPTAIDVGQDPMPLASEALRGEGCLLIDEKGQRFTEELQARDIVARAIWNHIAGGHRVFLDAREALGNTFSTRFPRVFDLCVAADINPAEVPIPVCPAAHYHMGGIVTDARGRSDVAGLWACGEVACTGLHGANRLASNSLLEAASFGQRVADDINSDLSRQNMAVDSVSLASPAVASARGDLAPRIRATMTKHVGVIRDREGLEAAINFLSPLAQTSDRAMVGLMIAQAALRREESRGAHYRQDFPRSSASAERSVFSLSTK